MIPKLDLGFGSQYLNLVWVATNVVWFPVLLKTGFWTTYTQFLPRPARMESNVTKLKRSWGLTVLIWILWLQVLILFGGSLDLWFVLKSGFLVMLHKIKLIWQIQWKIFIWTDGFPHLIWINWYNSWQIPYLSKFMI